MKIPNVFAVVVLAAFSLLFAVGSAGAQSDNPVHAANSSAAWCDLPNAADFIDATATFSIDSDDGLAVLGSESQVIVLRGIDSEQIQEERVQIPMEAWHVAIDDSVIVAANDSTIVMLRMQADGQTVLKVTYTIDEFADSARISGIDYENSMLVVATRSSRALGEGAQLIVFSVDSLFNRTYLWGYPGTGGYYHEPRLSGTTLTALLRTDGFQNGVLITGLGTQPKGHYLDALNQDYVYSVFVDGETVTCVTDPYGTDRPTITRLQLDESNQIVAQDTITLGRGYYVRHCFARNDRLVIGGNYYPSMSRRIPAPSDKRSLQYAMSLERGEGTQLHAVDTTYVGYAHTSGLGPRPAPGGAFLPSRYGIDLLAVDSQGMFERTRRHVRANGAISVAATANALFVQSPAELHAYSRSAGGQWEHEGAIASQSDLLVAVGSTLMALNDIEVVLYSTSETGLPQPTERITSAEALPIVDVTQRGSQVAVLREGGLVEVYSLADNGVLTDTFTAQVHPATRAVALLQGSRLTSGHHDSIQVYEIYGPQLIPIGSAIHVRHDVLSLDGFGDTVVVGTEFTLQVVVLDGTATVSEHAANVRRVVDITASAGRVAVNADGGTFIVGTSSDDATIYGTTGSGASRTSIISMASDTFLIASGSAGISCLLPRTITTHVAAPTPNASATSITAYPNPWTDQLNIVLPAGKRGQFTATLTDIRGGLVWSHSGESNGTVPATLVVPAADLPSGVYMLTVEHPSGERSSIPLWHQR